MYKSLPETDNVSDGKGNLNNKEKIELYKFHPLNE